MRINEDLEYFLKEKHEVFLALREFLPEINGMYEFRCFVKGNSLNAISQYNHPWIIQELLNKDYCEQIKQKIRSY